MSHPAHYSSASSSKQYHKPQLLPPKPSQIWSCLVTSFLSSPTSIPLHIFAVVKDYLASNYFKSLSGSQSFLWELSNTFPCSSRNKFSSRRKYILEKKMNPSWLTHFVSLRWESQRDNCLKIKHDMCWIGWVLISL